MPSLPPSVEVRSADCTSPTLRASPWGEVPSLSRRRGDSLTFRYLHFYRLHTSLYLNTSSIQLNSYAYRLQSPLSRPSGRQLSPRRASLVSNINSSCLPKESLSCNNSQILLFLHILFQSQYYLLYFFTNTIKIFINYIIRKSNQCYSQILEILSSSFIILHLLFFIMLTSI